MRVDGTEGCLEVGLLRNRVSISLLVALIGAAAVLAACRDSEGLDFSDEIPGGAPHIDQHGLQFDPREITVEAGETVYFTSSETAVHAIYANGEGFSGDMNRGDIVTYVFEEPGEYEITCAYHPQQSATITVE